MAVVDFVVEAGVVTCIDVVIGIGVNSGTDVSVGVCVSIVTGDTDGVTQPPSKTTKIASVNNDFLGLIQISSLSWLLT